MFGSERHFLEYLDSTNKAKYIYLLNIISSGVARTFRVSEAKLRTRMKIVCGKNKTKTRVKVEVK